ncbi:MAG: hypothetical protein ACHQF2_02645 [Flavobacteriales bacterium]
MSALIFGLFLVGITQSGIAQQDNKGASSTNSKKREAVDTRSDSQKSYVPPRTRDANRHAGGGNAVKTPERIVKTTTATEKKTVIRK